MGEGSKPAYRIALIDPRKSDEPRKRKPRHLTSAQQAPGQGQQASYRCTSFSPCACSSAISFLRITSPGLSDGMWNSMRRVVSMGAS